MNRRRLVVSSAVGSVVSVLGTRVTALAQDATPLASPDSCPATSPEANTAVARRWYEEALTGHDASVLDEILLPEGQHTSAAFPNASSRAIVEALIAAFPDLVATVDQTVAEGDFVTVRWTMVGSHDGPFQIHEPTGIVATIEGINIFRFECGRIAEVWSQTDIVGMFRQLGLPLDLATPAS